MNLVAATFITRESRFMIGIITITTGVLFMKAEATKVPAPISAMASLGLRSVRRMMIPEISSSAPVRSKAPLSTNIAPMVIGALLLKAETISSGGRNPSTIIRIAPATATVTGGRRSRAKATNRASSKASPTSGAASGPITKKSGSTRWSDLSVRPRMTSRRDIMGRVRLQS